MLSVYIIYFNNDSDVIPIATCESYTDAERNFENTTLEFVKIYYADEDRNAKLSSAPAASHPVKICKYEEGVNSSAILANSFLKNDDTFQSGLLFVRKRYEACIYEKICYPGKVYNSYSVKYVGRIGVLAQELKEQSSILQRMKDVSDSQEDKIRKLEVENKRMDAEIKRLEYTNTILEQNGKASTTSEAEIVPGKALTMKPNPVTLQKIANQPLLDEIKERFSSGNFFSSKGQQRKRTGDLELEKLISEMSSLSE